jgi:hypothetical protein
MRPNARLIAACNLRNRSIFFNGLALGVAGIVLSILGLWLDNLYSLTALDVARYVLGAVGAIFFFSGVFAVMAALCAFGYGLLALGFRVTLGGNLAQRSNQLFDWISTPLGWIDHLTGSRTSIMTRYLASALLTSIAIRAWSDAVLYRFELQWPALAYNTTYELLMIDIPSWICTIILATIALLAIRTAFQSDNRRGLFFVIAACGGMWLWLMYTFVGLSFQYFD